MNKHLVFVYGTLKKGFYNNPYLVYAKYLGEFETSEANYRMIDLGSFPGVVKMSGDETEGYIAGELYEVDDNTLKSLDVLEGNGQLYNRALVDIADSDGPIQAWMYMLLTQMLSDDLGFRVHYNPDKRLYRWEQER